MTIAQEPRALEETPMPQACGEPTQSAVKPAPCLLRAEGLTKAFGGQVVLDGVDLEIRQGEVILLRGENGSGKTTLLNILTGNLEPDAGGIHYLADGTPRSYEFPRRWWQELNPFDHFTPEFVAQEGIGRTWQDVRLFGAQTLRDNISVGKNAHPGENPLLALFAPGLAARREKEIREEVDAMLARLGLEGRESSSADKISLGQSKRVAIARAVAAGAKVLFLDEPLAGLDRQGIADVLSLLRTLVQKRSVTLVIVEHVFNQAHLKGLVTTDWLLAAGTLTALGASSATMSMGRSTTPSRPEWFDQVASAELEIVDDPLPRGGLLTRIRPRNRPEEPAEPVLEIRDLVVNRGGQTVIGLDDEGQVAGFDLALYQGEIAILQAPNGWGKSTLVDCIAGLVRAEGGEIYLGEANLRPRSIWQRHRFGLRIVRSDLALFASLKVQEAMSLAPARVLIGEFAPLKDKLCGELSGGQSRRIILGYHPIQSATRGLLILDEPFRALDSDRVKEVTRALAHPRKVNMATLILTPRYSL